MSYKVVLFTSKILTLISYQGDLELPKRCVDMWGGGGGENMGYIIHNTFNEL